MGEAMKISWVTPRIGIADADNGILATKEEGIVVVNVSREVSNAGADVSFPLPTDEIDKVKLDFLSNWINYWLKTRQGRIVIHCLLGVDISPLVVAWYLHKNRNLSLDESYERIRNAIPQVNDRRDWIKSGIREVIEEIKSQNFDE